MIFVKPKNPQNGMFKQDKYRDPPTIPDITERGHNVISFHSIWNVLKDTLT